MGVCVTLSKFVIILFTLVAALIGAAIIYVGIAVNDAIRTATKEVKSVMDSMSTETKIFSDVMVMEAAVVGIVIGIGCYFILLALCGSCGAITRNRCALIVFVVLILLLTIIIAIFGALVFLGWNVASDAVDKDLLSTDSVKERLKEYDWKNRNNTLSMGMDVLQRLKQCCGFNGYKDWDDVRPDYLDSTTYPDSCCSNERNETTCSFTDTDFHRKGCVTELRSIIKMILCVAIVILSIAALQLFVIVLSYILICAPKRNNEDNARDETKIFLRKGDEIPLKEENSFTPLK